MTKEYYNEFYSEWLKFMSYRKWQPVVSILLIIFGILVSFFYKNKAIIISLFFIGTGIYEFFDYYYTKRKWLNERLVSNITDKEIEMIFEDELIKSKGPFINAEIKWNGISKVIETKKGLFLIPENGISIYLQKISFNSEDQIKLIINKATK